MNSLTCPVCQRRAAPIELVVCSACRHHERHLDVDRFLTGLQQYSMVVPTRFNRTNSFHNTLVSGARANDFSDIEGPASLEVVGQRSEVLSLREGEQIVRRALGRGRGISPMTDLRSVRISLIEGGNLVTFIRLRAMMPGELAGVEGAGR